MKSKKFNIDDKVFAKVKGYPAWPAIITQVNKTTYGVRFYGTGEIGACTPQNLHYYLRFREKFIKNQKRKDFINAVEQIDIAIAECGGIDGNNEAASISTTSISETGYSSDADNASAKRRGSDTRMARPRKKRNTGERKSRRSVAKKPDSEMPVLEKSALEDTVKDQSPKEPPTLQNYSRIGPRLTITDIKVITTEYLNTVIAYASHVKKNAEIYEKLPEEKRYNKGNELVLVRAKSGNLVGIKYNRDEDLSFDCEYKRAIYDESEANTMLSMKVMLETGQCLPEEDLSLFETNLDITDTQIQESIEVGLIERKKNKLDWLKIENKLAELDTEIKKHLGLEKANPEAATKLLGEMLMLKIEPLMLVKHPSVFEMAKRLRRYIGNVQEWNYTESERETFEILAERVREKAEIVYEKFVEVLNHTGPEDPWDYYLEQVARFKEQVMDMVECNVFALTAPPTSRATFFDSVEDAVELKEMVDKLGKNKISTVHLQV